ncbi:MAG: hypothetical protein ACRYFX_00185 [Janthinobacterium lividum]
MGNIIELRQITAAEADAYLRQPSQLIQAQRSERKELDKLWHIGFDYDQWEKAHKRRSYKWKLLFGLVSVSEDAFDLLAHGGQPIGGLEESWELEASAEVLSVEQIFKLYNNLLLAPVLPATESYEIEAALIFQDLLAFLQEAVEAGKALLIIEAP